MNPYVKSFLIEMGCIVLMVYLCTAGCAAGWHILELREGTMLLWAFFIVMPSSLTPYFLAQVYLLPSPFNTLKYPVYEPSGSRWKSRQPTVLR